MVTVYTAQARINSSSGRVGLPSTEEVSFFFPQMNVLESGCVNYPISSRYCNTNIKFVYDTCALNGFILIT